MVDSNDLARAPEEAGAGLPAGLTAREVAVLRLIARGCSTDGAAKQLHLSPATVKTHLRNASAKLGTTSRAAATAKATSLGVGA